VSDPFALAEELLGRNTGAPQAAPEEETVGDSLRKGFNSSLLRGGAQLHQAAGLGGELVSANDFTAARYADAKRLGAEADAVAPEISKFGQVKNVNTALRYGAGMLGGMGPQAGAAVGGTLLAGPVGGALALTPFAAGDIAERQQADPEIAGRSAGFRSLRALGGGLAVGAIQNVGPGMFINKLAAKGVRGSVGSIVGKELAESIGVNAAGGAGGEALSQYAANQDKPLDTEPIKEAGIGGAVAGTAFGAVGAGAKLLKRPGEAAIKSGAELPKAPDLSDTLDQGRVKADDTVGKMARGEPLVPPEEFATSEGQAKSDQTAASKAKEFGAELLNDVGLGPDQRQAVADALQNTGDRASQIAIATAKQAMDKVKAVTGRIAEIHENAMQAAADASKQPEGVKMSEDHSGFTQAVVEQLVPFIQKVNPDLLNNAKSVNQLGDSVRMFMQYAAAGDATRASVLGARLSEIIGPGSQKFFSDLAPLITGGDRVKAESYFKSLNEVTKAERSGVKLQELVRNSLSEDAQGSNLASDIPKLTEQLTAWARGDLTRGMTPAEAAHRDTLFLSGIREHFGPKADGVLRALEKEAKVVGKVEHPAEFSFNEEGDVVKAEKLDTKRIGIGKDNVAVMDPTVFRNRGELGMNRGDQLLRDTKAKYPDHDVRFERLPESDFGHVIAEKAKDTDKLQDTDVQAMRLDTKKYPNSADRLEYGGMILDTRRIAKTMDKRMEYSKEGQSRAERLSEAFISGLAKLTEQFGKGEGDFPKVPDSAVIGKVGGKDFTYGEAKALDKRSATDKATDAVSRDLNDKRAEYKTASPEDKAKIKESANKLLAEREARKNAELAHDGDVSAARDEMSREASKDDQIHAAAKDNKGDALINRSNMDGSPRSTLDGKSPLNLKPARTLVHKMREADTAIGRKLADRLETLLKNSGAITEKDMAKLSRLGTGMKPSEVAEVVNDIARKYKDVISENKGQGTAAEELKRAAEPAQNTGAVDAKGAMERLEYLNNPPKDYTTQTAKSYVDAAKAQIEKLTEKMRKLDEGSDAWDALDDIRHPLREVVKKGLSVLEGDASIKDLEGTPDPKSLAAKKAALVEAATSSDPKLIHELSSAKDAESLQRGIETLIKAAPESEALKVANERMSELVQDPQTAYNLAVKRYSLEHAGKEDNDGRARLISRLADQRADRFKQADASGKYYRVDGDAPFGAIGKTVSFFAADGEYTHAFVVPRELVADAQRSLAEYPPNRAADVLGIFAAQHTFYDRASGALQSFGPDPRSPAGRLLKSLGMLNSTGERFSHGVDVTRVEGVSARQLSSLLADALAYTRHIEGKPEIPVIWKRTTGANKGKEGGGMFSAEETGTAQATAADRASIAAHIDKVLGKSVELHWADLTHAGEFERMRTKDIIRLAVTALDPLSTAHHESLHAFFAQLKDAKAHDVVGIVEQAANAPHVLEALKAIYKDEPAVLKQLLNPEERAAYMYQAWSAGQITLGAKATSVMGKIAAFIRSALGIWTNDERALMIMEHFQSGDYAASGRDVSAIQRRFVEGGRNQAYEAAKSFTAPLVRLGDEVLSTGSARLRDTGIPALNDLADLVKRDHLQSTGKDQGFIQAARIEATKRRGALGEALAKYDQETLHSAMEALQRGEKAATPEANAAQRVIKDTLRETREYMVKNGVDVGDLGPDYFPRVWDTHYISKNQAAFKDMLEPYIRSGQMKGSADELIRRLATRDGNEFGIEQRTLTEQFEDATAPYGTATARANAQAANVKANSPGMQFKKERLLSFISAKDAAMFVNKDLLGTLNSYIGQAARKAEWEKRLGGGKLQDLFERAKSEGATPDQLKTANTYLKGVDGTLGDSLNPHARRLMGNMIVYQNIRLLPFAAFSSVVDPMGVMVRGGSVKDAWKTFKRGVSEIPESFGKEHSKDEGARMAELVGVVDAAVLSGTLGDTYTQGMVGGFAKKANNFFFKANLMEGLNRSFRIGASEAAMSFMARHADGTASKHSERWINELSLQPGDIKKTADGRIALTEAEGLKPEQVERVHAAINQWVDGAVLRPDAADKPIWMNDPHYALISHLKQFTYSFQKTIIERVVHEAGHGNYTPIMALASYVPVMLAADAAKGLIQGGGAQPAFKDGWEAEDYLWSAIQRGGLLGVGQFGYDMAKDIHRGGTGVGTLAGPTLEQFSDTVQLLGGHKQFGNFVLNALPANALYKDSLGAVSTPDSMQVE
jgi:hypothetical protein